MKRKCSIFLAITMVLQLLLSSITIVSAEEESVAYQAPESPAVTYNMNLDWKFYDVRNSADANLQNDIWTVMQVANDSSGRRFYEVDFDDSSWETVSIPHGIGGGTNSFASANMDSGGGYRSVLLYRKTFTVPQYEEGGKVFFELEGIRQGAYVWVNGEKVGYYEAGVSAMGFDISNYVEPGEQAVIAILNDGLTARGTYDRIPYETVPGEEWGSSYSYNNYKSTVGDGVAYVWNTMDFNEPQIGLVYDAYLHVKGDVYQTLPLYNNLKTTGNYIYADNFDIKAQEATIHVEAEIRNESAADGEYTLEVAVVDSDGILKYNFESEPTEVKKAEDAGVVYETAVENNVYSEENIADSTGLTKVNTPDVTYINVSYSAEDLRFWSLDDPYLYTVYTILKDSNGNAVDVQKEETGFRKVTYDENSGVLINDKAVWLKGYAQRSTNEWAVIGSATDWLQDYDMSLLKENNANFIRWMHVAPKPAQVRSSDKYGVAVVCPAGDKEGVGLTGREWSQRTEAMRDVMIYYRNSPSVLFWETGNSAVGSAANAEDMARIRDEVDPHGMRFIGARSTTAADQLDYDYNYAGTMYGNYAEKAISAMESNGKMGPIMETEYARDESPRRVWDLYSPPDYDYVNKYVYKNGNTGSKDDGYDVWNLTQEDAVIRNVSEYNGYYSNRAGYGDSLYSAAAMMVWSDSNMHTRNTATENCRTSGRVDPVRQTKEMYEGTKAAQSTKSDLHIVGHWSYPELAEDTYNYFGTENVVYKVENDDKWSYDKYVADDKKKRDPLNKTVYVIGSADVKKVELYRIDGETETLIGTDEQADSTFIYQFDNIDVTQGDAVLAKAYDARGTQIATDEIERTYDAVSIRLTPHTAVVENEDGESVSAWKADGSDIAYIDVEVVDKNGNVCALNYDRIDFKYSGEGEYLGGYNSGSGANCFQNMEESRGFSSYFDGIKDGVSTLGKDYVYAENGTNRIFIRSTRTAGNFTITATMPNISGVAPSTITISSTAVETEGGLTTEMQSVIDPGVSEPPVTTTVDSMKPLMLTKNTIDWSKAEIVVDEDSTVYYDVYLNDEKLNLSAETYLGIMDTLFGPVYEILMEAQKAGADGFEMVYNDSKSPVTLEVSSGGHTYQYQENRNQICIDNTQYNECVDMPVMKNGTMVANLPLMLGYAGVSYSIDNENHILNITVQ